MINFEEVKGICERTSKISATVVDDFLLHYAAAKNNLAREFDQRIATYKHITQQLDAGWVRMLKSQYIGHKVFKTDGLLKKYLTHVEIKRRPAEEQKFLEEQLGRPWRFSFSIIVDNPSPDFYRMEDVFSGESFLLYSKSTTQILKEQPSMLWFNLIAFNGACWQTFGPLSGYQGFDLDDIFFFATEVNPEIDDEETLVEDVESNPVPYMLLWIGSRFPVTVNNNDELLMLSSEYDMELFDTGGLKDQFKVEYNRGVYRIGLKGWDEPPHFASAYYDEAEKLLCLSSMTDRSFAALAKKLNESGFKVSGDPQIHIHPTLLVTAEQILKRKIELNPYEKLFTPEISPESKTEIAKINAFLQAALPAINAGKKPDIESLAKEVGVDVSLAEQLVANAMDKIKAMKKGKR